MDCALLCDLNCITIFSSLFERRLTVLLVGRLPPSALPERIARHWPFLPHTQAYLNHHATASYARSQRDYRLLISSSPSSPRPYHTLPSLLLPGSPVPHSPPSLCLFCQPKTDPRLRISLPTPLTLFFFFGLCAHSFASLPFFVSLVGPLHRPNALPRFGSLNIHFWAVYTLVAPRCPQFSVALEISLFNLALLFVDHFLYLVHRQIILFGSKLRYWRILISLFGICGTTVPSFRPLPVVLSSQPIPTALLLPTDSSGILLCF